MEKRRLVIWLFLILCISCCASRDISDTDGEFLREAERILSLNKTLNADDALSYELSFGALNTLIGAVSSSATIGEYMAYMGIL